jgi:hypothetical protein
MPTTSPGFIRPIRSYTPVSTSPGLTGVYELYHTLITKHRPKDGPEPLMSLAPRNEAIRTPTNSVVDLKPRKIEMRPELFAPREFAFGAKDVGQVYLRREDGPITRFVVITV